MANLQVKLHDKQLEIFNDPHRFKVVAAGRRFGKSRLAAWTLIIEALKCTEKDVFYVAPTYQQARDILWSLLKEIARDVTASAHENTSVLTLVNGRKIYLKGSDRPDTLRGVGLAYVVIDEYADMKPQVFEQILRPALADVRGGALFIGTPKGNNHFREFKERALVTEGWKFLEFKASDTGILDPQELSSAKNEMGEDKYRQEFECSFDAPVEGAYYGTLLNEADNENRVTKVPKDGLAKIVCSWDLGVSDSTCIWVAQIVGKEIQLIDCTENHGVGLDYYVSWLRDNGYDKGQQILPHDVRVREMTTGRSRLEVLMEAGLDVTVAPSLSIADGIQAVRRMLPRCWFDIEGTKNGLVALRNYRREFNEKQNVFYDKPVHDWSSHFADSFRYLAIGLVEVDTTWSKPLQQNKAWVV